MEDCEYTNDIKCLALLGERGAPLLKNRNVYKHQKEAIEWMKNRESHSVMGVKGGILSFSPGLGKTLTYIIHSLLQPKKTSTLIVVPKSLITNTLELLQKFFGNRVRTVVFYPKNDVDELTTDDLSEVDFCITTYEILAKYSTTFLPSIHIYNGNTIMSYRLPSKRNYSAKGYKLLYATHWDRVIMEEAHIKLVNPSTIQYQSVMALSAECRWAITGSIINNRSSDFWAAIHCLGYTFIDSAKKWNRIGKEFFEKHRLGELLWFRNYEQCEVKMPELEKKYIRLALDKKQTREYNSLVKKTQTLIHDFEDSNTIYANVLVGFGKIRAYCSNNPQKYDFIKNQSGKEKCIVFSGFIDSLVELAKYIGEKKCSIVSSKTAHREKILEEFENNDKQFLLATYKVCGVGLNLQYIKKCFLLEPYWNNSTHEQALHRCWRIGQTSKVMVYRLTVQDSLEENIYKLCEQKKEIQSSIEEGCVIENISKLDVSSIKILLS